jgi:parvulin-like peptidyl-prolyl isomerase
MSNISPIFQDDILQQIKLSCQMPTVLSSIVERRIVAQKSQELGIQVSVNDLQKAADSFRLKHQLITAEVTIQWLKQMMLSLDDLETIVTHTVLSSKLANHLFSSQVESYFAEHQLDYITIAMHEVLLQDGDLAMELFYALQEQEIMFAEVARQYAQDPETRRRGGYKGLVTRVDLKPELSAAIFAATPPQILKPIAVGKQFYLVWVEEVITPTLDDALRSQILADLFANWLKLQVNQSNLTQLLDSTLNPSV